MPLTSGDHSDQSEGSAGVQAARWAGRSQGRLGRDHDHFINVHGGPPGARPWLGPGSGTDQK